MQSDSDCNWEHDRSFVSWRFFSSLAFIQFPEHKHTHISANYNNLVAVSGLLVFNLFAVAVNVILICYLNWIAPIKVLCREGMSEIAQNEC